MFSTCCGCSANMSGTISRILVKNGRNIVKSPHFSSQGLLRSIEKRSYVTHTSKLNNINIFDQETKTHHKNIAAQRPDHQVFDYLRVEVSKLEHCKCNIYFIVILLPVAII